MQYIIIDDSTAYQYDSDTVYYKDIDFWLYRALQDAGLYYVQKFIL